MTSRATEHERSPATATSSGVDEAELDRHVKQMYTDVATEPRGGYHFEVGRGIAERLGYDPRVLDQIPGAAVESFAGVGHHFDLAALGSGERVLDLGSGSGTDSFVAAVAVGPSGRVDGIDMTGAQLDKAERLRAEAGRFEHVRFHEGRIEELPFDEGSFDCVISNGVINLVADKQRVFDEAARVLRPGGRLALSDIVTRDHLPESVVCNATLWAACIGGAMQREDYQRAIEAAGLSVEVVKPNDYRFLSGQAERAAGKFGVQSVSLLAVKP
ncbi:MAG: methyltransferase domain-containing protein [Myxococcota bacterium]